MLALHAAFAEDGAHPRPTRGEEGTRGAKTRASGLEGLVEKEVDTQERSPGGRWSLSCSSSARADVQWAPRDRSLHSGELVGDHHLVGDGRFSKQEAGEQ